MRSETLNRKSSSLMGNIIEQLKETDFVMLTITLVLAFYGLVMVFSASYYFSISESGNPFYYLIRDGIWVVLGIILMCLGALIDYRKYNNRKIILAFLLLCLLLLVLVLTPAGSEANDATR